MMTLTPATVLVVLSLIFVVISSTFFGLPQVAIAQLSPPAQRIIDLVHANL
jgi:hypothetical protein